MRARLRTPRILRGRTVNCRRSIGFVAARRLTGYVRDPEVGYEVARRGKSRRWRARAPMLERGCRRTRRRPVRRRRARRADLQQGGAVERHDRNRPHRTMGVSRVVASRHLVRFCHLRLRNAEPRARHPVDGGHRSEQRFLPSRHPDREALPACGPRLELVLDGGRGPRIDRRGPKRGRGQGGRWNVRHRDDGRRRGARVRGRRITQVVRRALVARRRGNGTTPRYRLPARRQSVRRDRSNRLTLALRAHDRYVVWNSSGPRPQTLQG